MKNRLLLTLIGFILSISSYAQDRIYFKNGSMVEAKILEVGTIEVVFKKAANPDGPTYHELKTQIALVEYANGTKDAFETTPVAPVKPVTPVVVEKVPAPVEKATYEFKKNSITYALTDVFFKRITLAYERILLKGYISIKIPVSFGLGSNQVFDVDYLNSNNDSKGTSQNYYYSYNLPMDEVKYTSILRKNTFGLELYAYPFGQHATSFYVGPAFYYGLIDYKIDEIKYYTLQNNTSSYYNYSSVTTSSSGKSTSYSGVINTGFSFRSNSAFTLNLQIGLGFRQNHTDFDDNTVTILNPSFQIGYQF